MIKIFTTVFQKTVWCLGVFAFLFGCKSNSGIVYDEGAVTPDKALATFAVEPGFKIEMIAAEPLVSDPVDMEIDEYGRLFVVEMHGYPLDKGKTGRIVQLTDVDGDGTMDKRTVFMDGLLFPNGIMRWKKGFIITDAPNVYYIEDTDNDGVADKKDTLLTGFSLSNPHVNVNNPVYGLDNWIYLAHFGAIGTRNYKEEFGDEGGEIYFTDQPAAPRMPKNANGRSVRFQLQGHRLEMTASRAQFGQTFDPWGHHLMANNGNHAYHEVIDNRYLERNPGLLISDATQSISDHGDVSEVFQTTISPDRQLFSGVGVMTSSSGVTAYTGGAFPNAFNDSTVFVAESVSNLVHADRLKENGSSFIASRSGRPNKEFLTSTDAWSRPVNMYIGPDGALYVLDYYRKIIEHPEWMSDEAIKEGGLYKGNDMGRIYRISAKDVAPATWSKGLHLGDASTEELVAYLANANSWWRINAQRLLIDRMDKLAVPLLENMANNVQQPMGRLHARWTLEGMNQLTENSIREALKDPVPGNRENAIRLAEIALKKNPELLKDLLALQKDPNPKVRFQLLCTLGGVEDKNVQDVRNKMLFNDISDPWMQIAALSATAPALEPLLAEVLQRYEPANPAYAVMAGRLAEMMAASLPVGKIEALMNTTLALQNAKKLWQAHVLEGIASGIKRNSPSVKQELENTVPGLIKVSFEHPDKAVRDACYHLVTIVGLKQEPLLNATINRAIAIALDSTNTDEKRAGALRFMKFLDHPEKYQALVQQMAMPESSPALQTEALKIFAKMPGQEVSEFILQQWAFFTPEIREVALESFMSDTARINLLLTAVEKGAIPKTAVGRSRITRLMSMDNEPMRNRARLLFTNGDEEKVIKAYQAALSLKGDAEKGKAVFIQNCKVCHQKRGELGIHYGPDMGTVRNWLPKNILANILSPNLSVAAGFDLWELETKSGERVQGLLSSESSSAVTLLVAPGSTKTFNREEVKLMKGLNTSVMPEGFADRISQQDMADLISFLRE